MKSFYFFVVTLLFSQFVFAADATRTVNEKLVYTDPTLASANKFVYGVSADGFIENFTTPASNSPNVTGSVTSTNPGITGYAGYGDITVIGTYRYSDSTTQFSTNNVVAKSDSYDVGLRWLVSDLSTNYFTPFLLGGYQYGKTKETLTFTNGTTPSAIGNFDYHYSGTYLGAGGIIPINETWGFRADYKHTLNVSVSVDSNTCCTATSISNAKQKQWQAVAYYNFDQNINLQAGFQSTNLTYTTSGLNLDRKSTAPYIKLGYTFR